MNTPEEWGRACVEHDAVCRKRNDEDRTDPWDPEHCVATCGAANRAAVLAGFFRTAILDDRLAVAESVVDGVPKPACECKGGRADVDCYGDRRNFDVVAEHAADARSHEVAAAIRARPPP